MAREIPFVKMHGTGNDYIYVTPENVSVEQAPALSKKLSHRHFGIGADGLVIIGPSTKADFEMRMFNADGSEGLMCGNAARCIGKYVFEKGMTRKKNLTLETRSGLKELVLTVADEVVSAVTVDMGEPTLDANRIPLDTEQRSVINELLPELAMAYPATCVSMGNPHVIFFVEKLTDDLIDTHGPRLEHHQLFPQRANVGFAKVINRTEIELRTWERGSNETLACGTNVAATLVAAVLCDLTERKATIHARGGDLIVHWKENNHVYQTGPAAFVFEGVVRIED